MDHTRVSREQVLLDYRLMPRDDKLWLRLKLTAEAAAVFDSLPDADQRWYLQMQAMMSPWLVRAVEVWAERHGVGPVAVAELKRDLQAAQEKLLAMKPTPRWEERDAKFEELADQGESYGLILRWTKANRPEWMTTERGSYLTAALIKKIVQRRRAKRSTAVGDGDK